MRLSGPLRKLGQTPRGVLDQGLVQGREAHILDQPLGRRLRPRLAREQLGDKLGCLRADLVQGGDSVHEPEPHGLGGIEAFRGEKIAPAGPRAHGGDDIGRDGGRNDPEPHLGKAKRGDLGGQHHIASRNQADAESDGGAGHHRKRRRRHGVEPVQQFGELQRVLVVLLERSRRAAGQLLEVEPGTEGAAVSQQHQHPQFRIVGQRFERFEQGRRQFRVDGIGAFGAVDRHPRDPGCVHRDVEWFLHDLPPLIVTATETKVRMEAMASGSYILRHETSNPSPPARWMYAIAP